MKRLPPIEKIYEALTAVADGRVIVDGDPQRSEGYAKVTSSDGTRTYDLSWDVSTYSSNDNATYWQGYPGYPVIALLMVRGKLPYDEALARNFAGVNWTELNSLHRNDYAAAVSQVIAERGLDPEVTSTEVQSIYSNLGRLPIAISRSPKKPPVK